MSLLSRITEFLTSSINSTSRIVRTYTNRVRRYRNAPTISWGRPDYDYWRRAYNCQVIGMEISGLFIRPIVGKIAAWSLGRTPNFTCKNRKTQQELESWIELHHAEILEAYRGSLKQGDSFMVINSDLSVTLLPPDSVDPIVAEDDFGKIIGWRVNQVLPHPTRTAVKMKMIDDYFDDRRVHTVENPDGRTVTTVFPNLIGINPVIHIPNRVSSGEKFGRPEAESLPELFHRYGQTLEAAIEGNILQGRPTPVISFNTVQDLNTFWRRYGKQETTTLANGQTETVDTLTIDLSEILTLSGATFSYESPGTFSEDTERLLGLMFYLVLEHIELPEFVFGNAISSSKASAETQMPIFEIFIRMRQKDCLNWILQIANVVVAYKSLMIPGVLEGDIRLQWAKLTQNGRLTLDTVSWAYGEGLLDARTSLILLPLDVDRPDEVLAKAKLEFAARQKLVQSPKSSLVNLTRAKATNGNGNRDEEEDEVDPSLRQEIQSLDI